MALRILVVGHWMLDHIIKLPGEKSLLNPLGAEHIHTGIISHIGGSGYHFSMGAKKAGFKDVTSIICYSPDEQSSGFIEEAMSQGIKIIEFRSRLPFAQTVLIYDTGGRRASFGTRGSNLDLPAVTLGHIKRTDYDIIFVAGHLLEDSNASDCIVKLLRTAKKKGAFVVLDLVPHHVHRLYNRTVFKTVFKYCDGIISKTETLCPILCRSLPQGRDDVNGFISALLSEFRWVCIQLSNNELNIGFRNGDSNFVYSAPTGYRNKNIKAGALDYPVARELYRFVSERLINRDRMSLSC